MKCDDFSMLIRHWPWPLTPWPWTFVVVPASCVQTPCKIWAKSNNPLQSYWRFSTWSPWNFWGRRVYTKWSQECVDRTSPNLERTIRPSSLLTEFVSELRYLAAFANASASKLSDVEHETKFRTFWPPVKIRGGVDEISGSTILALPTTEPRVYIWRAYSVRLWQINALTNYSVSQKTLFKLSVTLSNLNRFSKFLHYWKACKTRYKTNTTLPTSP